MKSASVRFVALVAAAVLLSAACSSSSSSVEPLGNAQREQIAARDGFVLGLSSEPDTLNPVLGYAPDGGSLLFDGLLTRAADLTLKPALAAELPRTDGTTVTFKLRSGVRFHDGTPLTSADVVYTYQAVLDEKNNSSLRGDYEAIESVEAPDPETVVFRLKHPYAPFLQRTTLGIVPKQSLEKPDFNTKPIGTGPYRFVSRTPGDKIVLEANPDHWNGAPAIQKLVLAYAPDDNIRATRMAAGEFDATELSPQAAARFENTAGLTVYKVPSADYRGVMFPMEAPVTSDKAIRKAISLALDRAAMVRTILNGAGSPAFGPIAPGTTWHNPAVQGSATPNREEAVRILEQAGWRLGPDGIRVKDGTAAKFTLMYPAGDSLRKDLALAVASDAKRIGIDIELAGLDWDAIRPRMPKDALVMGYGDPSDPDHTNYQLFHSSFIGEGFFNPARYRNPEVDKLLEQGRRTDDPEVRKQAYDAFQQRIRQDEPWVYLVYLQHVYVVRGKWTGITPGIEPHEHATGGLFRNLAEWKPAS